MFYKLNWQCALEQFVWILILIYWKSSSILDVDDGQQLQCHSLKLIIFYITETELSTIRFSIILQNFSVLLRHMKIVIWLFLAKTNHHIVLEKLESLYDKSIMKAVRKNGKRRFIFFQNSERKRGPHRAFRTVQCFLQNKLSHLPNTIDHIPEQ